MTGHAVHFLERLKRVDRPEVELAMTLYNDPGLMAYALASLKLPEGAERVAVSLEDPHEGPFIVVTREGQFVTCLGRGMSPGSTPIVTRERLDGFTNKVEGMRQGIRESMELAGPGGHIGVLFDKLYTAGENLSREHFKALSVWQPLLQEDYLTLMAGLWSYWSETIKLLTMRKARRIAKRRNKNQSNPVYKAFWDATWTLHYIGNLVAMGDRRLFDSVPEEKRNIMLRMMAWIGVRSGSLRMCLLGLWSVARFGKEALRIQKEAFRGVQTIDQYICWSLGLMALGLRHRSMRSEVHKFLQVLPTHDKPIEATLHALHEVLVPSYKRVFEETELYSQFTAMVGRACWLQLQEKGWLDSAFDPATIPDDVAVVAATYVNNDFRRDPGSLLHIMRCLAWAAPASAEMLYMPEAYLSLFAQPWSIEDTLRLMDNHFDHNMEGGNTVQRAQSKIGRNDPCRCGSGKKYKHCCG